MTDTSHPTRSEDEIRDWIINKLANRLRIEPAEIAADEPLVSLGVDSMHFVVLVGELEDWLGCRFVSNPLIDYPSVNALSRYLTDQLSAGQNVIDPGRD